MCGSCGRSCLASTTRFLNFVLAMIGLALAIWGVYFAAKTQAFGVAAGVPLGLGFVDVVLGLIITTCGYKRLFFLRLFMLINGLLCIGEIAMAILYIVPGTQGNLIDSLNLDDATADWVNDNIATAGYIFLTVVAVKAVVLVFVFMQATSINTSFDDDLEALIGDKGYGKSKDAKLITKADKFGAFGDEGETAAAASRYREKNAQMYEKYGVKR